MIIRRATPADAVQIADFWNPQIRNTVVTFSSLEKSGDDVADMIVERQGLGYEFLVAEIMGEILGFVTYSQFRAGNGYRHTMEHTIILAPTAWGRGVGRTLMLAIEDHARTISAHSMIAGVSGENLAGVRFHAALGYEEMLVLPQVGYKFDRWFDLVLMQKTL